MSTETAAKSNPGPLGLLGFGMTTILLNLHNAELISLSLVIVAMGLAMGGAAQVIAGVLEFKNGNTFGGTAFTAYGFFWWSLVLIWMNPFKAIEASDEMSMGFYLLLWGIFTLFMFIGTLKHDHATQVVFGSLTLLFFLLALGDFTGEPMIHLTAGYVGIFCGASAIYSAARQVLRGEAAHLSQAKSAKAVPAPKNEQRTDLPASAYQSAVREDVLSRDMLSEDMFLGDAFSEDELSEDIFPEDELSEDIFPEDELSEDIFPEDEFSEDIFPEDEFSEDAGSEDDVATLSEYQPFVLAPQEEIPRVIEVKLGGATVRVPNGSDPALLAQVLRLIKHL